MRFLRYSIGQTYRRRHADHNSSKPEWRHSNLLEALVGSRPIGCQILRHVSQRVGLIVIPGCRDVCLFVASRSQRVGLIVVPGCLSVCMCVCVCVCLSVSTNCRPRQRTVLLLRSSSSSNGRARGRCCCCVAAVRSRQDSGSRQTLLVLQFLTKFANIWAQCSPLTYASTHVGFF